MANAHFIEYSPVNTHIVTGSDDFYLTNHVDDLACTSIAMGRFTTKPIHQESVPRQNYSHPFNLTADIRYRIRESRNPIHTTMRIFNVIGQEIKTKIEQERSGDII
jgi:hypothetical protein